MQHMDYYRRERMPECESAVNPHQPFLNNTEFTTLSGVEKIPMQEPYRMYFEYFQGICGWTTAYPNSEIVCSMAEIEHCSASKLTMHSLFA